MTELFMTVLDMSLKASFVILSVYLTRWFMCLGNPPRKWCYMLWGIVLIRLLIPGTIESSFSALPNEFTRSFVSDWGDDYIGSTHTYFDVTEAYDLAVEHGNRPIASDEGGYYVVTDVDGISPPKTIRSEIYPILAKIWGIGIAVMLLWNGMALWKLHRKLREAVPLRHQIYVSDQIDTAFVMGFGKGRIYLPADLTETERTYILRHEKCHLQRGDHRIKLLAFFALCIHWFNPLVWLAYVLAMRDMELSCDETATAPLSEFHKAEYAQTLLHLTTGHKRIHAAPVAFGEGDTAERIRHVFQYRDPGRIFTVIVMVLFVFSAFRLLTDPKEISYTFGASMYGYERIAYAEYHDSHFYEMPDSFCLTTDNVFWTRTDSQGWEEIGVAESYTVTEDEINHMMPYRMAMDDPPVITKVTDSKIVRFPDENGQHLFYLLTRHQTGSYYIAYGYSESEQYLSDQLTIRRLFPVMSGVGVHSAHEPFYQRCLESMLDDAVDVFATHLVGDGYQVIGFRTGIPKTDYGWAVFHIEDNAATFTGQMERFENAAAYNNGILLSNFPALATDTGEITDRTAYEVILLANPHVAEMQVQLSRSDSLIRTIIYPELQAPDMVVIPWADTAKADSTAYIFTDAEGNIIPDSAEELQQLENFRNLVEKIQIDDETWAILNRFAPGRLSYMTDIAEQYLSDAAYDKVPTGIRAITVFRGTNTIVQFDLSSHNTQYKGYYYSPDDVPVPFQNAELPLTETEDGWTWQGEGDNHGTTCRIAKCWFSYEANL